MPITLSDFRVERAAFEIRYSEAFSLWDRSGAFWNSIKQKYPIIKIRNALPSAQEILVQDKYIVDARIDKISVTGLVLNNKLDELIEIIEYAINKFIESMHITDLQRIGFRIFYEKRFSTVEECHDYINAAIPMLVRKGKHFNIEGEIKDPELAIRWEGPATGIFIRLHRVEQKAQLDIPPEFIGIEIAEKIRNSVVLDIDCYVHASTSVSKFNARALVEGWIRAVRRDVEAFVNG